MKNILYTICMAIALPAMAQTSPAIAPPAKAAAKKPAAATPAKPKKVLMTRDELRVCFKQQASNSAENTAIEEEKEKFQRDRADIIAVKDGLLKQTNELESSAKAVMAEQAELLEERKEFDKVVPKSEVKAMEVKRTLYNEKAEAHGKRIDAYNNLKQSYSAAKAVLDARIDTSNAQGKVLQKRAETYNESVDDWRAACSNKPYEEADEIAVKKGL
jgi:hypothetical protein